MVVFVDDKTKVHAVVKDFFSVRGVLTSESCVLDFDFGVVWGMLLPIFLLRSN